MRITLCFVLCCGLSLLAQPSFTLSLDAPHPASFNAGPAGTGAQLTNLVRSEPLTLVMSSTPTASPLPPAQLTPRRIALWLGTDFPAGTVFPQGTVFLGLSGSPPPIALFDAFAQPWAPMFGPPLSGASASITLSFAADLFGPVYGGTLPNMALQAVCEDSPGNPLLLSNAVRFQIVDPEVAGFAPSISSLQPQALSGTGVMRPQGSELGGNAVTFSGANFLAQSNWIQRPPRVLFGTQESPLVFVQDNSTLIALAPATLAPTNPPFTHAGLVNVSIENDNAISPASQPHAAPMPYLYLSGQTPVVAGSNNPSLPPTGAILSLLGSGFLNNATVTLSSATNPALSWSGQALTVGAGGVTLAAAMPPFCSGAITCTVTNVDEVVSAPITLQVAEMPPVLVAGTPNAAVHPRLGGQTHITISAAGGNVTLLGGGYLQAGSPMSVAPTIPPGSFYPTRTRLNGTLMSTLTPQSNAVINGLVPAVADSGMFRPALGAKLIELENPPCVSAGNVVPIMSVPCVGSTSPCTALVQSVQPPSAQSFFPGIVPASGCSKLRIQGSNFFSTETGTTSVDYSVHASPSGSIDALPLYALRVPAVLIGDRFAPRVTLISESLLEVEVPARDELSSVNLTVTVFNPDARSSVLPATLIVAPDFTNTAATTSATFTDLDETTLLALAAGAFEAGSATNPAAAPAMLLISNPTPQRERIEDPFAAEFGTATSYDFALLLNTRAADGSVREFSFDNIDLPATITLTNGGSAVIPPWDPAIPAGGTMSIAPGTTLRVIVKATGFTRDTSGRWLFEPPFNHPLLLHAHDEYRVDALVNLSGGSLVSEALTQTHPLRTRVLGGFAPAGAGSGGKGGSFGAANATSVPAPNFAVANTQLAGWSGTLPADRSPQPLPGVRSEGTGGGAAGPAGIQGGGGGGAGAASNGAPGIAGSATAGLAGFSFGNASHPGPILLGMPPQDCFVFGSTAADFALIAAGAAVATGKITGGAGGGGGGGATALFVPAQSFGGRGGHGGGCLMMNANCVMELGPHAALLCNGEQGQLGLDVFPFANSSPTLPVCLPGAGGGGAGGTILLFALAHVCLTQAGASACSGYGPASTPALPVIHAAGGLGGPPPGVVSAGATPGGAASAGRIRAATRWNSPHLAELITHFTTLSQQSLIAPAPQCPGALPASFHSWPGL